MWRQWNVNNLLTSSLRINTYTCIYLYIYHHKCSFSLVMGKYILTTKSSKKSDSQHQTLINQNIEEHLIKGLHVNNCCHCKPVLVVGAVNEWSNVYIYIVSSATALCMGKLPCLFLLFLKQFQQYEYCLELFQIYYSI